jgi:hypothetical protein
MLARVSRASLTTDSVDATSIGAYADPGTLSDLGRAGQTAGASQQVWPFSEATCHDDGGQAKAATSTAASSSCDLKSGTVLAQAGLARPASLEGVTIGYASSSVSSLHLPTGGMGTVAQAIVKDVDILDRVHIGSLETDASTWAHGLPHTAGARLVRTFSNVQIDTNGDGTPDFSCTVCEPDAVAAAANAALLGTASVTIPGVDKAFYPNGSPGGYQAVIEKDRYQSYADRSLNDDDELEVPGLQIVLYNDAHAGRTRHVVQIAGVEAESHYGIYLLPTGETQPPPPIVTPPAVTLPPVVPAKVTPPSPVTRSFVERVVTKLKQGIGFFATGARRAGLLGALWLFLLLPVYLGVRRRLIA